MAAELKQHSKKGSNGEQTEDSVYKKAAMLLFPLKTNWLCDRFSHRFVGYALKGDAVASAIDPDYKTEQSEVFRLTTEKGKVVDDKTILSEEEFDDIIDYALQVCETAIEEIKSGYIAPSPDSDACKYCAYGCLCHSRQVREFVPANKASFKREQ